MSRSVKRVLGVLAIAAIAIVGAVQAEETKQLPKGQAKTLVTIQGMTCGACTSKVEAVVAELKGVVEVKADYEKGTASVTYITEQVDVNKIIATINEKTDFKAAALSKKKSV